MIKLLLAFTLVIVLMATVVTATCQTIVTSNADAETLRQAVSDAKGGIANITFSESMVISLDSVINLETLSLDYVVIDGGWYNVIIDCNTYFCKQYLKTKKLLY